MLSKSNAASRNRETIKSQMACDLQRHHLSTPSSEIKRRLPKTNWPCCEVGRGIGSHPLRYAILIQDLLHWARHGHTAAQCRRSLQRLVSRPFFPWELFHKVSMLDREW